MLLFQCFIVFFLFTSYASTNQNKYWLGGSFPKNEPNEFDKFWGKEMTKEVCAEMANISRNLISKENSKRLAEAEKDITLESSQNESFFVPHIKIRSVIEEVSYYATGFACAHQLVCTSGHTFIRNGKISSSYTLWFYSSGKLVKVLQPDYDPVINIDYIKGDPTYDIAWVFVQDVRDFFPSSFGITFPLPNTVWSDGYYRLDKQLYSGFSGSPYENGRYSFVIHKGSLNGRAVGVYRGVP